MARLFAMLNASLASMSPASWLGLVPLGLPLNPSAAAGSALAGLSRPETRVLSDAVRRFRQNPGDALLISLFSECDIEPWESLKLILLRTFGGHLPPPCAIFAVVLTSFRVF